MVSQDSSHSSDLNVANKEAWSTNAGFWDTSMGDDGNEYFVKLELPALRRLVDLQPSERALDLATGNGLVARWLSELGGDVTATDAIPEMLDLARARSRNGSDTSIKYSVLDVTKSAELDEFTRTVDIQQGSGFDVVTMNMAIMDIPTLSPLAAALPRLLSPRGRFVATLLHPVFCTTGASRFVENRTDEHDGRIRVHHSVNIKSYLHIAPSSGEAIPGQPVTQLYFERPLHQIFAPFFDRGLVLDGLEEIAFSEEDVRPEVLLSTCNFTQIPQILAFRMRYVARDGNTNDGQN